MSKNETELLAQRLIVRNCRRHLTDREQFVDELRLTLEKAEHEMNESARLLFVAKEKLVSIALRETE